MKHIRPAFVGIALIGLLFMAGCLGSGSPRGAFPAKAGEFTLVNGPIAQKEDKESKLPAFFLGEYRSAGGASVAHQVMPFGTAEEAAKEFANRKEISKNDPPGYMSYESGGRLVRVDPGGTTTVYWIVNNWYCYAATRNGDAATQLADGLAYK